ncbi:MAG: metal ABC transporter ATP-binding protein [archaeon]|nr:metal ABC transporter ATP-binding protein [archaeon]
MVEQILKVDKLKVELGGERIIENLSFNVKKGDVWVILGPNGAGKTILLRTLVGVLPYKGKIEWKKNIKIGYVPQRLPMIKDIPINVMEFFELKKVNEKKIIESLESVGIGKEILNKKIGDLSSGQFQRILVAWALIDNPEVLLFDEPFAGIDISGTESIYDLLEKLQKNRNLTILLVSHDLNIVHKFAKNVLCVNKEMLCCGVPKKVLTPGTLNKLYGGNIKFYSHSHD